MIRLAYYFNKTTRNCFSILYFKVLTQAYLVTFMTDNRHLTPPYLEDFGPISAAQICYPNIIFNPGTHFPSFNFFNNWFV